MAMKWREKLVAPKRQASEGIIQGAPGPNAFQPSESMDWAGKIPSAPIRPGIWKYSDRKAKK